MPLRAPLTNQPPPEPGPESGGLRLRLTVSPDGLEGFHVRLDLLNVTNRPVVLQTAWPYDGQDGSFPDYLAAAISIETYPPSAPAGGQVPEPYRTIPQKEIVLQAGEVVSAQWQTKGRRLKNRVTRPLDVQNPEFLVPGLYTVRATIELTGPNWMTSKPARLSLTLQSAARPAFGAEAVFLRSNEQMVSVGASPKTPRHTYGRLAEVDREHLTAWLDLGALHKLEPGDQFEVHTGSKAGWWKLTLTNVLARVSCGILEPQGPAETPRKGTEAVLIRGK